MYIDSITMRDFRTFKQASIDFLHPDQPKLPEATRPKLVNMNLIVGRNGSGKTTLLKGVSIACLGPAITHSGLFPYHLVRLENGNPVPDGAFIEAQFTPNDQDRKGDLPDSIEKLESKIHIGRTGDLELFEWQHSDEKSLASDLQQQIRRVLFCRLWCKSAGRKTRSSGRRCETCIFVRAYRANTEPLRRNIFAYAVESLVAKVQGGEPRTTRPDIQLGQSPLGAPEISAHGGHGGRGVRFQTRKCSHSLPRAIGWISCAHRADQ